MRILWLILGVLAAAALVVAFQPARPGRTNSDANAKLDDALAKAEEAVRPARDAEPAADSRPEPVPETAKDLAAPPDLAAAALARDLMTERAARAGTDAMHPPRVDEPVEPTPDARITAGLDRKIPGARVEPGAILRRDDGSLLADGKYVIRGDGSDHNPYVISWDLLASAMDTFQPRVGADAIPQRIAMLDGARIRIDGYLAFITTVSEADEVIVMLNQWDGCCIGVPPTAYDGILARLASPVSTGRRHSILYGTVEGTLRVEPEISERWLYGLYILDGASIQLDL